MVTISFDASNVPEELRDELETFFTRIAADLSNYIGDEVPVGATANLRNSVQVLGYSSNEGRAVVAVRADYANVVRLGREPGTFPEFEPLKKWVSRVIGEAEYSTWGGENWEINTLEDATYLVGRKIEQEGTDPNPYLERSLKRLQKKYG